MMVLSACASPNPELNELLKDTIELSTKPSNSSQNKKAMPNKNTNSLGYSEQLSVILNNLNNPHIHQQTKDYIKKHGENLLNTYMAHGQAILKEPPSKDTISYFKTLKTSLNTFREHNIFLNNMKQAMVTVDAKLQLAENLYAKDQYFIGKKMVEDHNYRTALTYLNKVISVIPSYKNTALLIKQSEYLAKRTIIIIPLRTTPEGKQVTKVLYKGLINRKTYYLTVTIDDLEENFPYADYLIQPVLEQSETSFKLSANVKETATNTILKSYAVESKTTINDHSLKETVNELVQKILPDIDKDNDLYQRHKTANNSLKLNQ